MSIAPTFLTPFRGEKIVDFTSGLPPQVKGLSSDKDGETARLVDLSSKVAVVTGVLFLTLALLVMRDLHGAGDIGRLQKLKRDATTFFTAINDELSSLEASLSENQLKLRETCQAGLEKIPSISSSIIMGAKLEEVKELYRAAFGSHYEALENYFLGRDIS